MAVVPFSRLLPKPPSPPRSALYPPSRSSHRLFPIPSPPRPLLILSLTRRLPHSSSGQENGGASETVEEEEMKEENDGTKKEASVAEEIKEMMAARKKEKEESSGDLFGGVVEEIREIEWPVFGKVVGTTGVVLAVIAGSSVALLTVNAVLAEISDRVFAGKGLQDFFG